MSDHELEGTSTRDFESTIRGLAVEVVDYVLGYTVEFSPSPEAHEHDYDWVESRITEVLAELGSGSSGGDAVDG